MPFAGSCRRHSSSRSWSYSYKNSSGTWSARPNRLCRALEQIAGLVSRTETRLAQRPDTLNLKLEFAPPAETELRLEDQTRGIRITW